MEKAPFYNGDVTIITNYVHPLWETQIEFHYDSPLEDTILLDVDGVLTDGRQYITEHGDKLFKAFHCRDRDAIRTLITRGFTVLCLSADDWQGVRSWCESLGATFVYTRSKETLQVRWERCIGVGDSEMWDGPFLSKCNRAFIPLTASSSLKERFTVLNAEGGQGVVEKLLEYLSK